MFENSAAALFEIMADTKKISKKKRIKVRLKAQSLEELLYKWLCELVFLKDAKRMVFGSFKAKIKKQKNYLLNANIFGEKINYEKNKQTFRTDVKAITKHMFSLEKKKGKFTARVVPDI